jgi:hypothetical protein
MGVILHFHVVPDEVTEDPEDFDRDVSWGSKLCMIGKHHDLHSRIFQHDAFGPTRFLVGREIPAGQVPAGALARVLARFRDEHPGRLWPEELAAIAYLEALPPDRWIAVSNG